MGKHSAVAREISYATTAKTRRGRVLIRAVENATGRLRLIKRVRGYEQEVANGRDFWEVMTERYGLQLEIIKGALSNIPRDGPVVVLSNHPYGILDGLMMGRILSQTRGDFRILAHRVFRKAEDINKIILPISFDETKEAVRTNLNTRKVALEYLQDGGAIGIFPGGSVSSARRPFGFPIDPEWRTFTAKMISRSNATVVPIFFEGYNSRLFQICSHLNLTLRTALLINEFKRRVGGPVRVVIGEPLSHDAIEAYTKDPKAMMDFLREETYGLSPRKVNIDEYGIDF